MPQAAAYNRTTEKITVTTVVFGFWNIMSEIDSCFSLFFKVYCSLWPHQTVQSEDSYSTVDCVQPLMACPISKIRYILAPS